MSMWDKVHKIMEDFKKEPVELNKKFKPILSLLSASKIKPHKVSIRFQWDDDGEYPEEIANFMLAANCLGIKYHETYAEIFFLIDDN